MVFAFGARYDYGHSSLLNNPLSLTLAYQYHKLGDRKLDLTVDDISADATGPRSPETIKADGIILARLNLRF